MWRGGWRAPLSSVLKIMARLTLENFFFKKTKKTETEVDEEGGGKGGGAPRRTFAGEGHGVHRVAVVVADVILVAPHFVQANADLACICSVFRVEVRGRREQGERERACVKRRGCGGGSLAGLFLHPREREREKERERARARACPLRCEKRMIF